MDNTSSKFSELKELVLNNKKTAISVAVTFFLLISIPLGVYLAQNPQILKSRASEKKSLPTITTDVKSSKKPEFAKGELLIKLKDPSLKLEVRPEKKIKGLSSSQSKTAIADVDQSNPKAKQFLDFLQKSNISHVEKVFGGIDASGGTLGSSDKRLPAAASKPAALAKRAELSKVYKLYFDEGTSVLEQIQRLASSSDIEYVEPNFLYKYSTSAVPNDPYYLDSYPTNVGSRDSSWNPSYDYLWGLKKINIASAWNESTGSADIIVAVIDSGVDRNHPDLKDQMWVNAKEIPNNNIDDDGNGYIDDYNGWDFANEPRISKTEDNDPSDNVGHGTHVAGIIGAAANNGQGIVGVNWHTKIMAVKVGTVIGIHSDDAARGILYAQQNGARVMNASFGGYATPEVMKDAINAVTSAGVAFVASAGNESDDARLFGPAQLNSVVSVGSSDVDDKKSDFSNNIKIDFLAPGGSSSSSGNGSDILSLKANGINMYGGNKNVVGSNYLRARGTSMAAPYVTGATALLLSKNSALTPEEVRSILRTSADKVDGKDWGINSGYGRINIGAAMQFVNKYNVAKITSPETFFLNFGNQSDISFIAYGKYFLKWILEYGEGLEPTIWVKISEGSSQVTQESPQTISFDTTSFKIATDYTLRLRVVSSDPTIKGAEDRVNIWKPLLLKWNVPPVQPKGQFFTSSPAIDDIDNDGRNEVVISVHGGDVADKIYILGANGGVKKTIDLPARVAARAESPTVADIDPNTPGKEMLITTSNWGDPIDTRQIRMFYADGRENTTGWPVNLGTAYPPYRESPPEIIDLNGDGQIEIIASHGNQTFVFDRSGNLMPGWPKIVADSNHVGVVAGKLLYPESNQLQILVIDKSGGASIYDMAGNQLKTFNLEAKRGLVPAISLTDLDGDGLQEIIAQFIGNDDWTETIGIFRADGSSVWKNTIGEIGFTGQLLSPVVADLNNDGNKDIVVSEGDHIWFFSKDGSPVSGWSKVELFNTTGFTVGDSDGDGQQEVFASQFIPSNLSKIANGRLVFSVPFTEGGFSFTAPVISDIDQDNHLEILAYSVFGDSLRAFDLGLKKTSGGFNLSWPKYQYNNERIGSDGICLKLYCDVNNDGREDLNDGYIVNSCWGKGAAGQCRKVDVKCNGEIDISDVQTFTSRCSQIFTPPTPAPLPSGTCATVVCDINGDGMENVNDGNFVKGCMNKPATGSCSRVDVKCDGKIRINDMQAFSYTCPKIFTTPASFPTPAPTATPTPTPTPTTTMSPKRVFVTINAFNGNLGGLSGADAKCQRAVDDIFLGGTWKAWLSDRNTSAASRMTHYNGPYKLLNGTLIANNWTDLTDGTLQHRININEYRTEARVEPNGNVWTNSTVDGSIASGTNDCGQWSGSSSDLRGERGVSNNDSWSWYSSENLSCNQQASLYCFEQ